MKTYQKKKLAFLSLIIVFTVLLSCSKDDDNKNVNASLVGKWYLIKGEYYDSNGERFSSFDAPALNLSCPSYKEYKSDGTFFHILMSSDCSLNFSYNGTYSFDETYITYKFDGYPDSRPEKVTLLTSTDLEVEILQYDNRTQKYYYKRIK